jgi:hypothetical protein
MLFRMLLVERSFQLGGQLGPRPRQIFVTQSPVLARKVKEYFDMLMNSFSMAGLSQEDMLMKAKRPLVASERKLLGEEDRRDGYMNLPQRFSKLQDKDFPVITTVEKVTQLFAIIILLEALTRASSYGACLRLT